MRSDTATVKYIDVDTTQADNALNQLETHASMTNELVISTARKGLFSLNVLADLAGYVIPQWFNLMTGAIFMMGHTMSAIGKAYVAGGPLFWIQAGFAFTASAMMFAQAIALMQYEGEAMTEVNQIMSLLNAWSI